MRSDARRNRELILSAAVDLFTEYGPAVSMEEIARSAGLGVGTLYRHFPDRQSLLYEIATDSLHRLHQHAQDVLGTTASGWEALVDIIERCVSLPLALTKSLSEIPLDTPEIDTLAARSDALILQAVIHAQKQGELRRDLTPAQVLEMLSVVVCRPGIRTDDPLITVFLDGLRAQPHRPR
ncbi:transcriptional regulator, TetR family [Catenulispora acidiphila DSM 44928]|uniref:Transcriptional regulator, TetR family n=1 Tax=Catenulispora acidiphila (strain DSM 44928 / JCM 14897 / NBRC 102108 / NRRL B-24433 / ID139908) TaxID=479433 RepID=C7Q0Z5_CATAD|nr:TetR/AcrR family transcriptional regulator [Catenulispora acidiphila]ACU71670.1 transcriptional regulator, TetR family [Catenulispora acidiphila DSM 44928]